MRGPAPQTPRDIWGQKNAEAVGRHFLSGNILWGFGGRSAPNHRGGGEGRRRDKRLGEAAIALPSGRGQPSIWTEPSSWMTVSLRSERSRAKGMPDGATRSVLAVSVPPWRVVTDSATQMRGSAVSKATVSTPGWTGIAMVAVMRSPSGKGSTAQDTAVTPAARAATGAAPSAARMAGSVAPGAASSAERCSVAACRPCRRCPVPSLPTG